MTDSIDRHQFRAELIERAHRSIDDSTASGGSLWDLGRAVGLCDAVNLLEDIQQGAGYA